MSTKLQASVALAATAASDVSAARDQCATTHGKGRTKRNGPAVRKLRSNTRRSRATLRPGPRSSVDRAAVLEIGWCWHRSAFDVG
jgi:hypothetical protein